MSHALVKWKITHQVVTSADNLGSITRHPANFGAITRHAKTLCHPLSDRLLVDK